MLRRINKAPAHVYRLVEDGMTEMDDVLKDRLGGLHVVIVAL
jgi:hypothetical protein